MALEEFIIDLCEESVNGALLVCCTHRPKSHILEIPADTVSPQTFWLFQTYLHDLANQPASNAFQTCRRIYNKVQRIVFGAGDPPRRERIHENVLPTTVLSSLILASVAAPWLQQHSGPLAIAQARRPRPIEEMLLEALPPAQKLARSATVTGSSSSSRRERPNSSEASEGDVRRPKKPSVINVNGAAEPRVPSNTPRTQPVFSRTQSGTPRTDGIRRHPQRQSLAVMRSSEGFTNTSSLPDQRKSSTPSASTPPSPGVPRRLNDMPRRHSHAQRPLTPSTMSRSQKMRALRQNYFRCETQFLAALEGISSRLVSVPKPARLSALRAELALIAQDLPAEVDIPTICPATLVDGTASRSKHHRIVRINPAEAVSLNSAEKVPYMVMLEVLREDFDFNLESEQNSQLLSKLLSEKSKSKRRLFDTSDAAREAAVRSPPTDTQIDSVLEPANGDLGSPALLQDMNGDAKQNRGSPRAGTLKEPSRLSSGITTLSSNASLPTPRTSGGLGPISRSSSPGQRPSPLFKAQNPNQADVSALADHMRTASQMLAQLDLSTSKRPKNEVAAIKAKIIASMQSLEEQSFLNDETLSTPSFDAIMAKASASASQAAADDVDGEELDAPTDPSINSGKGAARMENDAITGGIQRRGDRDDPSAATFGEAWEQKKERIRRTSPYGWMKNWDLISVIVKTGADLRQEAFACQLIAVCSKIWAEHEVPVWVKNMRILVTGETSGLIETITNAVSLHSLKRSLTLASLGTGGNQKKRFATLQDHFTKTFGSSNSLAYQKAVDCFMRSLAAYSIISYIFQLKDRHNGNILIDSDGHVVHIDFGFMLSNSPGNMGFEAAPFKLTFEYVEVLGGLDAPAFAAFKDLMKDAFQALRREAERIVTLVELMGRESKMACYGGGLANVVSALRGRFVLEKSQEEAREWVEDLVAKSVGSYYTRLYDTFQYRTQGIY